MIQFMTTNLPQSLKKYSFDSYIGVSQGIQDMIRDIKKTLNNNATVVITGESGVGKEMIARIIHDHSPRMDQPFLAFNCSAIPATLLESELFGHVRGAFTDAHETKEGLFVRANHGTLFLDEITDMSQSMQAKILRVLQEKEVCPVGGVKAITIDARIICATNQNIRDMVKIGMFREDLFYRINVVEIKVPALRDRPEDIPMLVEHALKLYATENKTPAKSVSPEAMQFLIAYEWPGNVRELINVIYNLSIFVESARIELSDLKSRRDLFRNPKNLDEGAPQITGTIENITQKLDARQITLSQAKNEFEKAQIERTLKLFNGQITAASRHLQMPRPQVSRLIKKYGLKKEKTQEGQPVAIANKS